MEIRGNRECTECGTRWSYYDTGEIACPECGSLRSVGVDADRQLHTDSAVSLDLIPIKDQLADRPLADTAEETTDRCRAYIRKRGFIDGGELQELDETYLVASELRHAMGAYERSLSRGSLDSAADDAEQRYLLSLLDLDRPPADRVPDSLAPARGLAYADAVEAYRSDLLEWLDENDDYPSVRTALGRLDDHVRRVEALDGTVEPATAERLVEIAREIGRYLREGDEPALARAQDRLDSLA